MADAGRVVERAGLHRGEAVGLRRGGWPPRPSDRDGGRRAEQSAQHRFHADIMIVPLLRSASMVSPLDQLERLRP